MGTTFRKRGHKHTVTVSADTVSGDVFGPFGTSNRFGIAENDALNTETTTIATSGVHALPADSSDVWADGDIVYWDAADENLTDVADSGTNKEIGIAIGGKADGETEAEFLLNRTPAAG